MMTIIDFHGFIAKKSRTRDKTFVTESRLEHIVVGSEIHYLNGACLRDLQPIEVISLFRSRERKLLPSTQTPGITDTNFHGFVVQLTNANKGSRLVVTGSVNPLVTVGTILRSINGVRAKDLTAANLKTMFASRTEKAVPEIDVVPVRDRRNLNSNSSKDATSYAKTYDELTMFSVCALCGEEGPPKDKIKLVDCAELIKQSNLKLLYDEVISCLTTGYSYDLYDTAFAREVEKHLPDGLLRGELNICRLCYKSLKKKQLPVQSASNGSPRASINETQTTITPNEYRNIPRDALINGLFPGSIPIELATLTDIEQSMIAIYSSITKVSLQGGKNYSLNGALCYTIINDLTNIAQNLPRMPSVESLAILRQATGKLCKEYTYRTYYVKMALLWLKRNNHLYKNINYEWPEEHIWDDINARGEVPFLPLSADDIRAIDENDSENSMGIESKSHHKGKTFKTVLTVLNSLD
jgi:hypothetical protein